MRLHKSDTAIWCWPCETLSNAPGSAGRGRWLVGEVPDSQPGSLQVIRGVYFIRARIGGKLIRRSLRITVYPVATVRLSGFRCEQRAVQVSTGDSDFGRMTWPGALDLSVEADGRPPEVASKSRRERKGDQASRNPPPKHLLSKRGASSTWPSSWRRSGTGRPAANPPPWSPRSWGWRNAGSSPGTSFWSADAGGESAAGGKPVVSEFQARLDATLRETRHLKRVSA